MPIEDRDDAYLITHALAKDTLPRLQCTLAVALTDFLVRLGDLLASRLEVLVGGFPRFLTFSFADGCLFCGLFADVFAQPFVSLRTPLVPLGEGVAICTRIAEGTGDTLAVFDDVTSRTALFEAGDTLSHRITSDYGDELYKS